MVYDLGFRVNEWGLGENCISYWRKFVAEYFSPRAKQRLCLSQYESAGHHALGMFQQAAPDMWQCDLCSTKSGKGFEATFDVLARLIEIKFASGIIDELLYLDHPREHRFTNGLMMLEYRKAVQETVHEQFRVVREGHLRIIFSQDLKILTWEFCARRHEELLLRRLIAPQVNQLLQVAQKCQSTISESGSEGVSQQDLQSNSNISYIDDSSRIKELTDGATYKMKCLIRGNKLHMSLSKQRKRGHQVPSRGGAAKCLAPRSFPRLPQKTFEEEEHHEKGPAKVLKKAKEKAKKIKKALTKHGHGHEQELHGARGKGHHIADPVEEEFFPDPMKEEIVPPGKKFVPVVSSSHSTKPSGRVKGAEASISRDGYGNKVISMVTPVYEKVKGTGAIVMKKLPFSGHGTGTKMENQQGQDKGISAKEYLTEKLSPGEGDKALSEVVTEKLHLGGDKSGSVPVQQRFQESGN
ncbi:hypothetical protein F2Q69_00060326 [Brassica cretica]|uniref:Uncharacterized protein n=1 Tax=Brassica cretica TaxID=69181 RepID=A0A8S9RFQ6_BRACR|nr:hypothetical protein F2Q69_00060326 [Brassica cretica]